MRLNFSFLLLILAMGSVLAQDNVNEKKVVGFGCYMAGKPTRTVIKVAELLKKRKYKNISNLLRTGNSGEQFLAVVSLEKLSAQGRYVLSPNDNALIEKIKRSEEKVSVCSGCTYFDNVSLRDMFLNDNFLGSEWWIETILKTEDNGNE